MCAECVKFADDEGSSAGAIGGRVLAVAPDGMTLRLPDVLAAVARKSCPL